MKYFSGAGGFGEIYLCSDDVSRPVGDDATMAVKIEPHSNGYDQYLIKLDLIFLDHVTKLSPIIENILGMVLFLKKTSQ